MIGTFLSGWIATLLFGRNSRATLKKHSFTYNEFLNPFSHKFGMCIVFADLSSTTACVLYNRRGKKTVFDLRMFQ